MRTCVALLLALSATAPRAQSALVVRSKPGATVLVDSVRAGVVGETLAVSPGRHRVTVVADLEVWDPLRADTTLLVGAADTVRVDLALPIRVRVETLPIRAAVVWERPGHDPMRLGRTPLSVDAPAAAPGVLRLTLPGYAPAEVDLRTAPPSVLVSLQALGPVAGRPPPRPLPRQRRTRTRTLIDVGIGAATVAAGAVAVHTKFRADALDNRYRSPASPERGDEALRRRAERFDTVSLAALGAMQVGMGVIALRFILR